MRFLRAWRFPFFPLALPPAPLFPLPFPVGFRLGFFLERRSSPAPIPKSLGWFGAWLYGGALLSPIVFTATPQWALSGWV